MDKTKFKEHIRQYMIDRWGEVEQNQENFESNTNGTIEVLIEMLFDIIVKTSLKPKEAMGYILTKAMMDFNVWAEKKGAESDNDLLGENLEPSGNPEQL